MSIYETTLIRFDWKPYTATGFELGSSVAEAEAVSLRPNNSSNYLKSRERCYDFLKYFCRKFGENIGVFRSNHSWFLQKFDHSIGS
jgi:hypothetical protein